MMMWVVILFVAAVPGSRTPQRYRFPFGKFSGQASALRRSTMVSTIAFTPATGPSRSLSGNRGKQGKLPPYPPSA